MATRNTGGSEGSQPPTLREQAADLGRQAGRGARQVATLVAGISSDKARQINKFIKEQGVKGIQSQTQGEQIRVTGKKRDDLQAIIAACKEHDFDIPLQFGNFRD